MSDFVDYDPDAHSVKSDVKVEIRSAQLLDADALASVMSVRGGTADEHAGRAARLIERLDVLLIAEVSNVVVGWCGVQRVPVGPAAGPEWLIAGLTVLPAVRRQGIATQLLSDVVQRTVIAAPGEPIYSVINARNAASIDLHEELGFVEVDRAANFAGIDFTGGKGVLLRYV